MSYVNKLINILNEENEDDGSIGYEKWIDKNKTGEPMTVTGYWVSGLIFPWGDDWQGFVSDAKTVISEIENDRFYDFPEHYKDLKEKDIAKFKISFKKPLVLKANLSMKFDDSDINGWKKKYDGIVVLGKNSDWYYPIYVDAKKI